MIGVYSSVIPGYRDCKNHSDDGGEGILLDMDEL